MKHKRLIVSVVTGSFLGIFCIIGAQVRFNGDLSITYLFAFWLNRLLMGVVIGLISSKLTIYKTLIRGAIIGLFVSYAFYVSTDFLDLSGFLVGALYGIIIELVALKIKK